MIEKKEVLTPEEKQVISSIGDSLYTAEFLEAHLATDTGNILSNAPVFVVQMGVSGFMDAVRGIVKKHLLFSVEEYNADCQLQDIENHLMDLDHDELGVWPEDIVKNDELMDRIRMQLEHDLDCNVPYNSTVDNAICTVVAEWRKSQQEQFREVTKLVEPNTPLMPEEVCQL